LDLIRPDWPAPAGVLAWSTTRVGGESAGPYASLNLGDHVGDDPERVRRNRDRLRQRLNLPAEPLWLRQVHGCAVAEAGAAPEGCAADAAVARAPRHVCAVLTADCLPVLLCDRAGSVVAAVHAGWRGLAAGVLEQAIAALGVEPPQVLAWLGPAIGPDAFEIGPEVRELFLGADPDAEDAFRSGSGDRWLADLYTLARRRLNRVGVTGVFGGEHCTYSEPIRFFSYRRDDVTGRMASLIWLAPNELS
jgi:polyphenol oxidase